VISNKKSYTKKALTFSIVLLMIWTILGAGTTLAWFSDTSPVAKNTFYTGDLDLVVSYKNELGEYEEIQESTNVFDDYAIYEPGYVQVVYLKIENIGDIDFDYRTAITANDYTTAVNTYGQTFNLSSYLLHGVVEANSEGELTSLINTREKAKAYANTKLNNYNPTVETLEKGKERYFALIVRMPEEIGNEANHNGKAPIVKLGIHVKASQSGTLE